MGVISNYDVFFVKLNKSQKNETVNFNTATIG